MAFVGDGNNVARSLATACHLLGMKFVLACPVGYELDEPFMSSLPADVFTLTHDPQAAVAAADAIYTDTWVSMGQEAEIAIGAPFGTLSTALVSAVDKIFDAASGTFGVRLDLPNTDHRFPSGIKCELRFQTR